MSGGDAVLKPYTLWRVIVGAIKPTSLSGALVPGLTENPRLAADLPYKPKLTEEDIQFLETLVLEVDNDPRPGATSRPAVNPDHARAAGKGDAGEIRRAMSWSSSAQGDKYWERESNRLVTRDELRPLFSAWAREDAQKRRWADWSITMDENAREAFLAGDMGAVARWATSVRRPTIEWLARLERGSMGAIRDLLPAANLGGLNSVNLGLDDMHDDDIVAMLADGQITAPLSRWKKKLEHMAVEEFKSASSGPVAIEALQKASHPKIWRVVADHVVQSHTGSWVDYGNKSLAINGMRGMRSCCQMALDQLKAGQTDIGSPLWSAAVYGGRAMPRLAGLLSRAVQPASRPSVIKRLEHLVA